MWEITSFGNVFIVSFEEEGRVIVLDEFSMNLFNCPSINGFKSETDS